MGDPLFRSPAGTFDDELLSLLDGFLCNTVNDPNADIHIGRDSVRLLRALEMWPQDRDGARKLLQKQWRRD